MIENGMSGKADENHIGSFASKAREIGDTYLLVSNQRVAARARANMRAAGKEVLLAKLEEMLNADLIGVEGARKIWRDCFGGDLQAVKDRKPGVVARLFHRGS